MRPQMTSRAVVKQYKAEELLAKEHELSELALERQKEEYEKKIKNLEFQVNVALSEARGTLGWTPHETRLAKMSWEKWKKYQFTSLRDQIWGHAVLIKEANAIAMELNKQVEFQFTLLREGVYSPMPSDIPTVQMGQSTLVVEVRDERHGAIHYWSLNKLRSRLDAMRKLYEGKFFIFRQFWIDFDWPKFKIIEKLDSSKLSIDRNFQFSQIINYPNLSYHRTF